jgi:cell division protein ZapA
MNNLIPTNLVIGDRTYRVKIHPKDEEVVRKTVKTINDKIVEYKTQFAGKDLQDYIAMVLVWFATEQNAAISNQVNLDNVSSRLQTLERMIDDALEDKVEYSIPKSL